MKGIKGDEIVEGEVKLVLGEGILDEVLEGGCFLGENLSFLVILWISSSWIIYFFFPDGFFEDIENKILDVVFEWRWDKVNR